MLIFSFLDENDYQLVAGVTGLEPATSCVTGRRSNQAELHPQASLVQSWCNFFELCHRSTFQHTEHTTNISINIR